MKKTMILIILILGVLLHSNDDKSKKISFSGKIFLTMSKDDEMCRHFLDKFQKDMDEYGGLKPENYDEFKIDWISFKYMESTPDNFHKSNQYKILDLNHDGQDEILVFEEYLAFAGGEEPYVNNSIALYELNENNIQVLKNPIKNGRKFFDTMKNRLYYISSDNKSYQLKEFPVESIYKEDNTEFHPFIQLIYDGLRVMKYKQKDYFVMFGNAPQDGMQTIHFKDMKIFDKTMVVISKVDSEIKKQFGSRTKSYGRKDICYYLKVK